MKLSNLALVLSLALTQLSAQETSPQQIKIQAMIQEIKLAGEGERYEKMNAFKEELRTMNAQTRQEALAELQDTLVAEGTQTKTRTRTQARINEGTGEGEQTRTRTQTRNEMMQTQQTQQQLQMRTQMQNQKQTKTMNGSFGGFGH